MDDNSPIEKRRFFESTPRPTEKFVKALGKGPSTTLRLKSSKLLKTVYDEFPLQGQELFHMGVDEVQFEDVRYDASVLIFNCCWRDK